MEPETGKLVIAHLEFQLKASIINDMLHLQLFYFPTNLFYSIALPYDLLPKPANFLYENIAHLFSHLEAIATRIQKADYSLISFSEPDLIIRDTICQGKKAIEVKIRLTKASSAENIQCLRCKLKEQQIRLQELSLQCDLQYKIQEEYLKGEKILAQKYLQVTKRANYLEFKKKELEISKARLASNNRQKMQSLERLNFLINFYNVQNNPTVQLEEKELNISFRLSKKQSAFVSIIKDTISLRNDPSISSTILTSAVPVPLLGKWAFSITVVNLTNGLSFGLTKETQEQDLIGICQPDSIAISTSKQLLFLGGIIKLTSSRLRLTTGDTFKMAIDRSQNSLSFFANLQVVQQIQIPEKLKEQRMVPFVQLYSGNVIKINQWQND